MTLCRDINKYMQINTTIGYKDISDCVHKNEIRLNFTDLPQSSSTYTYIHTRFNLFSPRPAKTVPFVILRCLTPDDFTRHGRASGWEGWWVNVCPHVGQVINVAPYGFLKSEEMKISTSKTTYEYFGKEWN